MPSPPATLPPVHVPGARFKELNGHLLQLLRSLTPGEWQRPTVCDDWRVKDLAAHLLDGMFRRLALQRDSYAVRPHLVERQVGGDVHRHLVEAEPLRRLEGGVTHDDLAIVVDDDWLPATNIAPRRHDRFDRPVVDARVVGAGLDESIGLSAMIM